VLAGSGLAFDGGQVHMWSGHFRLHHELSPGGADSHDLGGGRRFHLYE
jgi:hypothetical protein